MFFEDISAPACSVRGLDVHPMARSLPVPGAVFSLLALIQMDRPRGPDCSWGTSSRPGTQNRSIVCAKSCDSSVRTASATPSIWGCYVAALPRRSRLSSASGPWLRCVAKSRHHAAAGQGKMSAIARFSAHPAMRRNLEQLLREDSTFSIVGAVADPAAISQLIDQNHVDVALADVPPHERLADWRVRHNQTGVRSLWLSA